MIITFWLAILRYRFRDLVGFVVWGSWLRSGEQFQPRAVGVWGGIRVVLRKYKHRGEREDYRTQGRIKDEKGMKGISLATTSQQARRKGENR